MGKMLWTISISRNSIVVFIGMILAYILKSKGYKPFKLTGKKSKHFISRIFPLVTHYSKCHCKSNVRHQGAAKSLFQIQYGLGYCIRQLIIAFI
jgi:hypothetical protein